MSVTVQDLFIYPVKSCGPIAVPALDFGPAGPRFDREWLIVDGGTVVSQVRTPLLCRIATELTDDALVLSAADRGSVSVGLDRTTGPTRRIRLHVDHVSGVDQGDEVAAWLSDAIGRRVRLLRFDPAEGRASRLDRSPKAFADMASILAVSQSSLDDLNARLAEPLPMNRFRPNIVVAGCDPFAEDAWKRARAGDVLLRGAIRCLRCRVTTTDQATGERSKEPLRTLATYRKHPARIGVMFGRYFQYLSGSRIAVGDAVGVET